MGGVYIGPVLKSFNRDRLKQYFGNPLRENTWQ